MKFSIIICGYNEAQYLDACFQSCLNQQYLKDEYEIIFIDNDSTDDSASIVSKYPEVRTAVELRRGPSEARNKGISMAKGDIFLFLDADAELAPTYLSNCEQVFNTDVKIGAVTGKVLPSLSTWISNYQGVAILENYPRFNRRKDMHACPSCNLAIRRDVIKKTGGFFEGILSPSGVNRSGEDKELCERIRKEGFVIVYEPSIYIRHDNAQTFRRIFSIWTKGAMARATMISMGKRDPSSILFRYNIPLLLVLACILFPKIVVAICFVLVISLSVNSFKNTGMFIQSFFIKPWMDVLALISINISVMYYRLTKNND
jgi:glycosyltransferase involved in cell wall biosynthesis